MKFKKLLLFLPLLATLGCDSGNRQTYLFQNVRIIDGTGGAPYQGAVRVRGNVIRAVGDLKPVASDSIIEGNGWALSPGFIDTHSHHDQDTSRLIEAAVSQGITTIIVGQDGFSHPSLAILFDSLTKAPPAVNLASFVGHNTLRKAVLGEDFAREASGEEIEQMKVMMKEAMESGALGLSTGLEYDPGIYSNTAEIIDLAKIAADYGGRYITHMRSEDIHLEESIRETLQVGHEAKIPVQISHFKLGRKSLWGKASQFLATLDSARNEGIDVTADVYPYEYWQSTMTVLFPKRDFDNRASAEYALTELTTPAGMIINEFKAEPAYTGQTLEQIATLRQEDPATAYMNLIKLSQETPGESIIAKSMNMGDIITLTKWPHTNLCSDGAPTGHPRGWGAFPRYLRTNTGDSLAVKVHKMTGQAAENLDLKKIGEIRKNYFADLVLFDPDKIADRATFRSSNIRAAGIHLVMVSGKIVYQQNNPTGNLPGRVILRK